VLSSKCQVVLSNMRITGSIRLKIDQHMKIRLDLGVDHGKSESVDSGLDRKRARLKTFIPAPLFDVSGSTSVTQSSDNGNDTEAILSPDTGVFSSSEAQVLNKIGGVLKPVLLRNPLTTNTEIKRKSLIGVYPLTETSVSSSSTINLIEDLKVDESDFLVVKTGTTVDVRSTIQQIQNTITALSEIGNESTSEEEELPQEYDHPLSETPMVSPLDPVKDIKFDMVKLENHISSVETLVIDLATSGFQQKSPPPIQFNSPPPARESSKHATPSKSLITEFSESQNVKITVQKSKFDGSVNSLTIPLTDSDPKIADSSKIAESSKITENIKIIKTPSQITLVQPVSATPKRESMKITAKPTSKTTPKTVSSPDSTKSNLNESSISEFTESFSSYSSGTRAAIFTIKAENLPKNGKKSSLRIGYQCDPFIKFFLSDVLVHGGRDYFKKHAKTGVWKFRIRETKLAGHTNAVVSAFDRSDKYGDTEIGSFKFKVEDLVTRSQVHKNLSNGKTKITVKLEFS